MTPGISDFGTTKAGEKVEKIVITSGELTVSILTLGAILQDVRLKGVAHSLTLGGNSVAAYEGPMGYFGAIVGPVANRIGKGSCRFAGKNLSLPKNEGGVTTLHGGFKGTHARVWSVSSRVDDQVMLMLALPDGEEGYPGNRYIYVSYHVRGTSLTMELTGSTDAPTIMNLANHSYWNLSGANATNGHILTVTANAYTPVDDLLIPTGQKADVTGTAFDLRNAKVLRGDTSQRYDHNFCLADKRRPLTFCARLEAPSGLLMEMESTEPGLQIYDGVGVKTAPHIGHIGAPYGKFAGVAIEAQFWPDAPNHPSFPSIALGEDDTYRQTTRWSFRNPTN